MKTDISIGIKWTFPINCADYIYIFTCMYPNRIDLFCTTFYPRSQNGLDLYDFDPLGHFLSLYLVSFKEYVNFIKSCSV